QHPATLAPVRFTFPSRLIPDPSFNIVSTFSEEEEEQEEDVEEEEVLQVSTVSEAGYYYSLNFPLDTLFYSLQQGTENDWSQEFKVEGLQNKVPVLMKGVPQQPGSLVIACKDGTNLLVELAQDRGLIETELKSPSTSSLFSLKSLVPSFSSRRDLSSTGSSSSLASSSSSPLKLVSTSSDTTSSPSQLISLAIATLPTNDQYNQESSSSFGFGVSRDKKLKIWNLQTGVCLRSIDLPKPSTSTSPTSSLTRQVVSDSPVNHHHHRSSQLLLPTTPQTFLKITTPTDSIDSIYSSYLTIYSPSTTTTNNNNAIGGGEGGGRLGGGGSFFIYGLVIDPSSSSTNQSGEISQLTPLVERSLPLPLEGSAGGGGVIDFEIGKLGLEQGGEEKWNLWVLDQSVVGGEEGRIRVCGLSELDDDDGDDDDDNQDEWKEISRASSSSSSSTSEWSSSYFDQEIQTLSPQFSIQEIFLKHVSVPGRYPGSSFDYALTCYEEMILSDFEQKGLEIPLALQQEYESDLIRTAAVVGCNLELEYSTQTGAALIGDYEKKLKLEWLKFVTLLNESRKEALFPIRLELDPPRGLVFVLGRNSLTVPVKEELVISLHRQLTSSSSSSSLQDLRTLFPQYPQSNFVQLVSLIKSVILKLSLVELNKFESVLLDRLKKPFTTDIEDISLSIFEESSLFLQELDDDENQEEEEVLDQVLKGLKSFIEPSKTIESFCQLLLSSSNSSNSSSNSDSDSSRQSSMTDLSNSLLSDLISSNIQARYELSKGLVLLLIVAWGGINNNSNNNTGEEDVTVEPPIASFEQTTSIAFTTLHSISTLEWIKNQIVFPTYEQVERMKLVDKDEEDRNGAGAGGFEEKFERLKMREGGEGGAEILPVPTYSLLNSLLRIPIYSPSLSLSPSSTTTLPNSLYSASTSFLSSIGLLSPPSTSTSTPKLLIDSTSANELKFFYTLQKLGLNEQVLELIQGFPQSNGTMYVKGRAELELGNDELQARKSFEKSASRLYFSSSGEGGERVGGLESILPFSKVKSLSSYYIHLVSLFVPACFDQSIARFSQLALDAIDQEREREGAGETMRVEDEQVEKDLWMKLFTSFAKLGQFEQAYRVIMDTPYHETKTTCLAHFISLVCENGASSLITTLPFVGLESDLERNLAFRARNSDPITQTSTSAPDYYKILYSFHVSKGDFRSAATVMYQQARRIGELTTTTTRGTISSSSSFKDLATAQCQSYLAATNALSLVEKSNAWVAVVVGDHHETFERVNKRRKIDYFIPDDEYDPTASRPLEMKELVDIRREYTIALARLQLSNEFPELERTNFHLEPEAVVALFTQTNSFDQAFQVATTLNVDMSSLFEILAEKCVGLMVHPEGTEDASWVTRSSETLTWSEGTLVSKALKLLQLYLQRHDSSPTHRYHLVVLEKVLATTTTNSSGGGGGNGKSLLLPEFLVDFLKKHQLQALLNCLIKFDKLDLAFKYSLETIQNSKIPTPASNFSTTLPYSIFDQLLSIPSGDSRNLSDDVLKQLQQDLRTALEERKTKLETLGTGLRR
ncbi:hypothetical protein JCM5350_001037, partial [Sporobolomyces pararoseus]